MIWKPIMHADPNAIETFLKLLVQPGAVFEIRALKVKQAYGKPAQFSGFYDYEHIFKAAEDVVGLGDAPGGVYVTLNPVKPAVMARRACRIERAAEECRWLAAHVREMDCGSQITDDRACLCEPCVAGVFRQRFDRDAGRPRHAGRSTESSGTARLACAAVHGFRLEHEITAPAHHAFGNVSAGRDGSARSHDAREGAAARSCEPSAVAHERAPAQLRRSA